MCIRDSAVPIPATVFVEPRVFAGDHCRDQLRRHLIIGDLVPVLDKDAPEDRAGGVEYERRRFHIAHPRIVKPASLLLPPRLLDKRPNASRHKQDEKQRDHGEEPRPAVEWYTRTV